MNMRKFLQVMKFILSQEMLKTLAKFGHLATSVSAFGPCLILSL